MTKTIKETLFQDILDLPSTTVYSNGILDWDVINGLMVAANSVLLHSTLQTKDLHRHRSIFRHYVQPWFLALSIEEEHSVDICADQCIAWMKLENEILDNTSIWQGSMEYVQLMKNGMNHLYRMIQSHSTYSEKLLDTILEKIDQEKIGKSAVTYYLALYLLFPDQKTKIDESTIGHTLRNTARSSWINHPHYIQSKSSSNPIYSKGKTFSVNAALSSKGICQHAEKIYGRRQLQAWVEDFYSQASTNNAFKLLYFLQYDDDVFAREHNRHILRAAMYSDIANVLKELDILDSHMRERFHREMLHILREENMKTSWPNDGKNYWHALMIKHIAFDVAHDEQWNLPLPSPSDLAGKTQYPRYDGVVSHNKDLDMRWQIWAMRQHIGHGIDGKTISDSDVLSATILHDTEFWNTHRDALLEASIKHQLYNQSFLPSTIVWSRYYTNTREEQQKIMSHIHKTTWLDMILAELKLTLHQKDHSFIEDNYPKLLCIIRLLEPHFPGKEHTDLLQELFVSTTSSRLNNKAMLPKLDAFYHANGKGHIVDGVNAYVLLQDITSSEHYPAKYMQDGLIFFGQQYSTNIDQSLELPV